MIKETTVLILCIRLLAQISSTTSNDLGSFPSNNLANVHRYRRSQNDILKYFYVLNRKTPSSRRIHGPKVHPFMRFAEEIVYINNKKRRKLSCTAKYHLKRSSKSFRGVLILHKSPENARLKKLVGVNDRGLQLWNKRMRWKENIRKKPIFTSRPVGSVSGFGDADLIIPQTDCGKQAGDYACQIFSESKSGQMKRYESTIYSLTKQQCLSRGKKRMRKIKIIKASFAETGGSDKGAGRGQPGGNNNHKQDDKKEASNRRDVMIIKIPYAKYSQAPTIIVGSCTLFMMIVVTASVIVWYFKEWNVSQ